MRRRSLISPQSRSPSLKAKRSPNFRPITPKG
ncbi:hypothetical protein DP46_6049 [Burkholderia phage BEK]|uniref:Uncharacterized protein n=1 Tax=Burkholderia phage BEK TaxID=1514988 RepID=A0A4P1QFK2_9CAUD|nr:hypothetical protein DP46_6049 [Burkholderia phage BEK]